MFASRIQLRKRRLRRAIPKARDQQTGHLKRLLSGLMVRQSSFRCTQRQVPQEKGLPITQWSANLISDATWHRAPNKLDFPAEACTIAPGSNWLRSPISKTSLVLQFDPVLCEYIISLPYLLIAYSLMMRAFSDMMQSLPIDISP
jgi:hypothetical protein